jgi:hypothetical protein
VESEMAGGGSSREASRRGRLRCCGEGPPPSPMIIEGMTTIPAAMEIPPRAPPSHPLPHPHPPSRSRRRPRRGRRRRGSARDLPRRA